ncbi:carbohydrate porin [Paraburkholderia dipogonis]|uniref:carbohydrate porin n=1 Tax=Paraburkholderia dipogonis TaxID=1211383 RepID=UPI0038B74AB8
MKQIARFARVVIATTMIRLLSLSTGVHAQTVGADCTRYDRLNTRALQTETSTPACETMFPELGGARVWLADKGVGFSVGTFGPSYEYDVLGHNHTPQLYGGQDPNWSQLIYGTLTYDLSRVGFSSDAQFTIRGVWETSNYPANNPHFFSVNIFAINQRFLDGRIEVQYGYYPVIGQFYGVVLGGNASQAALGPVSVIPVEVGMSYYEPTPAVDLTVRDSSKRWYDHFSITRSTTPAGVIADVADNPTGFRLTVMGARAMFVNEFGYQTEASATSHAMWFRAGGIYNTSHYTDYSTGGVSSNNYGAYLAATVQITNPHGDPRGLYGDVKVDYAPQDRNVFTKDYQVTLYYLGPFENRPGDMIAIGLTRDYFSSDAQALERSFGVSPAAASLALSVSYAARVTRGLYAVSGITFQKNPAFAPVQPNALLIQENLYFSF